MLRRWQEENVYFVETDDSTDIDTTHAPRSNAQSIAAQVTRDRSFDRSFWYGATLQETRTMLRDGWPEGLELVNKLSEEFQMNIEAPKSFRRRGQWCEDGDEPSWEREQAGHTNVWRASRRQTTIGPSTVHILCPWSHGSDKRSSDIQWNGVVLAVLCDVLEKSGYRVGATMTNCLALRGENNQFMLGLFHVKQPQQPLDLASLVPIVAHSATYRYFGIEWATLPTVFPGHAFGGPLTLAQIPNVPSKPRDGVVLNRVYNESAAKLEIQRVLDLFKNGNPVASQTEPVTHF